MSDNLINILNKEYIPTLKQLKTTNAYKFNDYRFKNIALQMFERMKKLKLENKTDSTKTIVTNVFRGFNLIRSKNILNQIADEFFKGLVEKEIRKEELRFLQEQQSNNYDKHNLLSDNTMFEDNITSQDMENWENL
jgi:hypothetical protein